MSPIIMLGLLTFVIVSLIVAVMYNVSMKEKEKSNSIYDEELRNRVTRSKILDEIYKGAGKKRDKTGSETMKITLLEKLNISPSLMKSCLN